ncbi:hypothetical protein ACIQUQ_31270 [Streptomyces sp. NPDC101118]|uniref:hypothetical protein n=1 Tax=Streptomyces sp. NPDC101118 TaxID=3366109 RepID=UPI00381BB278
MHPTRTTTRLLLGVACAVSAVSGCVNVNPVAVQPAATAGPPDADPRHAPRGGAGAAPVVVQAPALEALEAVPAERRRADSGDGAAVPDRAERAAGDRAASGAGQDAAAPEPAPAAEPGADVEPPLPPAAEPPGRERPGNGGPRTGGKGKPDALPAQVPVRPADVCALGRKYGQWKKDSPEGRICSGVYGE